MDNSLKKHLLAKRNEFIWALAEQDYNASEIAAIFNMDRSYVFKIVKKKPGWWLCPWVKREEIKTTNK